MSVPVTPTTSDPAWPGDALHLHRIPLSRTDLALAALTLARLSLVPIIISSFMKAPVVTTGAIVLFVVADIFDGVLARDHDADGPRRRALDSVVDRIGINAGMIGAYFAGVLPGLLLVALLARDAYCAAICARMVYRRNVAIKADWVYRALNLCVAMGAIAAPFVSGQLWVVLAGALLLLSIVVAIDLTRIVQRVESFPLSVSNAVLPAGSLRGGGKG